MISTMSDQLPYRCWLRRRCSCTDDRGTHLWRGILLTFDSSAETDCRQDHLRACWRICLVLGVIPPISLLYLRIKLKEPEEYNRQKMTKYPYWLILKFYGFRLLIVSLIWFIYDFSSYAFTIYSSSWLALLVNPSAPLWVNFGWNV